MNVFRATVRAVREWQDKKVEVDFALIGNKAVSFFRRVGGRVLGTTTHLGDKPRLDQLLGVMKLITDAYLEQKVDRVFLVSNAFVNTMTQKPTVKQLIPIEKVKQDKVKAIAR